MTLSWCPDRRPHAPEWQAERLGLESEADRPRSFRGDDRCMRRRITKRSSRVVTLAICRRQRGLQQQLALDLSASRRDLRLLGYSGGRVCRQDRTA